MAGRRSQLFVKNQTTDEVYVERDINIAESGEVELVEGARNIDGKSITLVLLEEGGDPIFELQSSYDEEDDRARVDYRSQSVTGLRAAGKDHPPGTKFNVSVDGVGWTWVDAETPL